MKLIFNYFKTFNKVILSEKIPFIQLLCLYVYLCLTTLKIWFPQLGLFLNY